MKEKEKKFSNFLKILLLMAAIFIGLVFYMDKVLGDHKANTQKRMDDTVIVKTTPIYHPPLNTRSEAVTLDINISEDANKTRKIPEGAEYITPEELLKREEENISDDILEEEIYNDSMIIPQDEIDNYKDAISISVSESDIASSVLGTPIKKSQNRDEEYPSLGTKIENQNISPF